MNVIQRSLRTCSRCGGTYDAEAFFGLNHARYVSLARRRTNCIGCEQTSRDATKQTNRWRGKARDTRRRHAAKFGLTVDELENEYGWTLDRLAHDAEHAYENGCPHCTARFLLMGHGLADITLDIVNPDQPPFYTTNTRWICATCNRQKGKTPTNLWGAKIVAWSQWRRWTSHPAPGRLFDPDEFA